MVELNTGRETLSALAIRNASRRMTIPGHWVVTAMIGSLAVVAVLMHGADLVIDMRSPAVFLLALGAILSLGALVLLRAPRTEPRRMARDAFEYISLFVFIVILGAVASYPAAAASNGFIDHALVRDDRLLGFDWITWYRIVAAHPMLQTSGSAAYASIYVTPAILLFYWAISGHKTEARQFLATFWLSAIVTLGLFVLIPARGPLAVLWQGPIPYMPTSALYQAQLIPILRDHGLHSVTLDALRGLVCAPSFHTTSAVLYIAAAWPIAKLRWPITAVNIAMLVATPVEGTHYLTDMIAGALVAITALIVVAVLGFWAVRRRPTMDDVAHSHAG